MKTNGWMIKALILGTVFFLAAWIVKPVGVSTQFSVLSGIVHNAVEPGLIVEDDTNEYGYSSTNAYYDNKGGKLASSIKHPLNYDFVFVLAIPLGGFLGYQLTKKRKKSDDVEAEAVESCTLSGKKHGMARIYIASFLGGFFLLYGARMADGCTSGHMMSGMMQGSVSGYLFAGFVFAVAIPTAILTGRRKGGN